MKKKPSNPDLRADLMVLGIEQFSLGRRFVAQENAPFKAREFVEFLVQLQIEPAELERFFQEDSLLEEVEPVDSYRKYSDYLKAFQAKYGSALDFKRKIISGYANYPDRQYRICRDYCRSMNVHFSAESFSRLFKTSQGQYDLLERLVILKYFIKFNMQLRIEYQKIMGDVSKRIVIPLAITGYGNYVSLLALDTRDGITRSFIMSCITKIESDLLEDFNKLKVDYKAGKEFNLDEFKDNEPSAHYFREKIQYKLRISEKSLHHFKHTFDYDFEILNEAQPVQYESDDTFYKVITFLATDKMEIERILFDYGSYAEILEPIDLRTDFAIRLKNLSIHYNRAPST